MSQLKEQANRINAQLSTGPRTPEGKAASSLNGTTHGFAASRISPKNPEAIARHEQRKAAYMARYQGAADDPLQADLIDAIATARTRVELIEQRQAEIEDETSKDYQLLQRYWREANRSFHQSIKLLESIRNQPVLQSHRAQSIANKTEAQQHAKIRLVLDMRQYQGELLQRQFSLQDKEKAAEVASLRQAVQALANQVASPAPKLNSEPSETPRV